MSSPINSSAFAIPGVRSSDFGTFVAVYVLCFRFLIFLIGSSVADFVQLFDFSFFLSVFVRVFGSIGHLRGGEGKGGEEETVKRILGEYEDLRFSLDENWRRMNDAGTA